MLSYFKPSDTGIRHMEMRTSGKGYPYWVWSKSMPALDPSTLNTVFYIYPSKDDADNSSEFGGTGFFFGIPSDDSPDIGFLYGVTCWHVINDSGQNPVLRINTKDGKYDTIETRYEDWIRHPSGDDVAIINLGLGRTRNYSFNYFIRDHLLTNDFVKEKGVGPGDEVVMIGRFRVHSGNNKNLPAAMFGYISMMPEEPLYNPKIAAKQESYLVEMRSISGFSGSPVLLRISPFSLRPNSKTITPFYHIRLIGVCWGYINVPEKAKDVSGQEYQLNLNSSMAAVVPIQKIMDLIDSEEEMKDREKENKNLKKINQESGVSASNYSKGGNSENKDLTKDEFEGILKKIARPLKKDDEEKKGT